MKITFFNLQTEIRIYDNRLHHQLFAACQSTRILCKHDECLGGSYDRHRD